MKAVLEFYLPEEESEFLIAARAMGWALAVWDLDQALRSQLKYGQKEFKSAYSALEWVREELRDILAQRGLNLDDVC